MASDESTGHRRRNLCPVRYESPGNPRVSGHRSESRDLEKSLLRRGYARLPPTFLVMKGSGVRVPASALLIRGVRMAGWERRWERLRFVRGRDDPALRSLR